MAVHSIFRPLDPNEHISRDNPVSLKKLQGEGTPSEFKTMLGWDLCTRRSRIFLPKDKCQSWSKIIEQIIQRMTSTEKEMESTIGRLNHVGYIIPNSRYFLNRLRNLLARCSKYGKQILKHWERDDLFLWLKFLESASSSGISFNAISYTKHTTTIMTDASEGGLGGYNPSTGLAWRFKLPDWMYSTMHINLLEFIASAIGIWLEVLESKKNYQHFTRIRALSDNSSAVGWLYKSSFTHTDHQPHDKVARQLASILLSSEVTITPQHTPGCHNIIADSLSRDFHIPDKQLTLILTSIFPTQTTKNFHILPQLPVEITSWISSLKASMTKPLASPRKQDPSKMGAFFAGVLSWKDVVSKINFLTTIQQNKNYKCCRLSQQVLGEMNLAKQIKPDSEDLRSHPPSLTYIRPFGRIFGATRL